MERGLKLLPGAANLIDELPLPDSSRTRSGGWHGQDAVHPLDAAPDVVHEPRRDEPDNLLDEAPAVPGWEGPGPFVGASDAMEGGEAVDNPLDELPELDGFEW